MPIITVLTSEELKRAVRRMAHEIVERNPDLDIAALLGIRTGGAYLASRLQQDIQAISGKRLLSGILDITLYRDDLTEIGPQPSVRGTELDFDVNGKVVVLIDDVLFTGRTIRAAIQQLVEFGRPKCIQLAVLIDRGHRELPIRPDYVGKNIPTALNERVMVEFEEEEKTDQVILAKPG